MPIEIQELVIRTIISDEPAHTGKTAITAEEKELLITECVNQVLDAIKRKEER
jgi:hypothetical protein